MANKKETQKIESAIVIQNHSEVDSDSFKKLCEDLNKVRNMKGILGYIIRNGVSASIDLEKPEKLVEYAIFTSQVMESCKELSDLFNLGNLKTIFIEGNSLKVLNLIIEENKINVFMDKKVNHKKIIQKLSL